MWDLKERGAPRSPHGKMSSDSPRLAVLRIRDRRRCCCCCCRPWVSSVPSEGRAGGEGLGLHMPAPHGHSPGSQRVPHAWGCNLAWRGPVLGRHAAQQPTRGQRHRPPGLTTRQKCLQTSLGQVSPAGSLCPPQPLGAVPLPLFGTHGSPGRAESDPMQDQRP